MSCGIIVNIWCFYVDSFPNLLLESTPSFPSVVLKCGFLSVSVSLKEGTVRSASLRRLGPLGIVRSTSRTLDLSFSSLLLMRSRSAST